MKLTIITQRTGIEMTRMRQRDKSYGYVCQPTEFAEHYLFYALGMGYIVHDRNFKIDREYFPGYLIMFCISGKLHIEQYHAATTLLPGQCCFMTLQDAHRYYSDFHEPCELLWLHFDGKQAGEMFRLIIGGTGKYDVITESRILPLVQNCITSYEDDSRGSCFEISGNIYQLLLLFLEKTMRDDTRGSAFLSPLARELDPFLNAHIREKITLEMMAEHCHLNPSYFCRRFRAEIKMTPMQYLMQKRIELAKYYLLYSQDKMSVIAQELGFYDQNHFSSCFSRATGSSPSEYRRKNRAGGDFVREGLRTI